MSRAPLQLSSLLDESGAICNYILIMEDITEKRKNHEALISAKEKAEDEDFNYLLLAEFLSKEGFHIIRAENGIKAVGICKTDPLISLVLMDIKMPLLNGYEAASQIRELRPELPIIAQTAYSTADDRDEAINIGCIDFISKPFTKDQVISKIAEHMKST